MKHVTVWRYLSLTTLLFSCYPALGQKTTRTSLNVSGTATLSGSFLATGTGQGTVNPFGTAALSLSGSQALGADLRPTGVAQFLFNFAFNRSDSFSVSFSYADAPSVTVSGPISAGTGAYSGATGSVTLVLVQGSSFGSGNTGRNWTMTGSGNITVAQKTTAISLVNFSFATQLTAAITFSLNATGSLTPFGNVTMSGKIDATFSGGSIPGQGVAVFTFNTADSVNVAFSVADVSAPVSNFVGSVTGGTGAFAGATGSMNLTTTLTSQTTFTLAGSGSITQPAAADKALGDPLNNPGG
jgi:hypothetical protein